MEVGTCGIGDKETLKSKRFIKPFMRKAFILLGIMLVLLAGCTSPARGGTIYAEKVGVDDSEYETLLVHGMERGGMVGSEKKLVLIVSGVDNEVWVTERTELSEIAVTGTGNNIHIAGGHNPRIMKSGLHNNIIRYN